MYQSFDRTKSRFQKNCEGFHRTKKSLRKFEGHLWCPLPFYNLGRAISPPISSRILPFSSATSLLDPTCDILLSLPFFLPNLSLLSLLSLPSSSLHLGILTSLGLLPSLGASTPPARLFYSTVAPSSLRPFNFGCRPPAPAPA